MKLSSLIQKLQEELKKGDAEVAVEVYWFGYDSNEFKQATFDIDVYRADKTVVITGDN